MRHLPDDPWAYPPEPHPDPYPGRWRAFLTWASLAVAVAALVLAGMLAARARSTGEEPSRSSARDRATSPRPAPEPVPAPSPVPAAPRSILLDQVYGRRPGVTLHYDAFFPKVLRAPRPAVVLLHGGGWWSGAKEDLTRRDPLGGSLVRAGYVVVAADYRLACGTVDEPRTSYGVGYTTLGPLCGAYLPHQVADVHLLVAHLRTRATDLHLDPARIALLGTSSGGHLALLAAATAPPSARVAAVVNWSGPPSSAFIAEQQTRPDISQRTIAASFTNAVGCSALACPAKWSAVDPTRSISADTPRFAVLGLAGARETQTPLSELEAFDSHLRALGWTSEVVSGGGACHGAKCGTKPLADGTTTGFGATLAFLRRTIGR